MVANLKEGDQVLDIAGGTGDLSLRLCAKSGPTGRVVHTDINEAMLRVGRDRLTDQGHCFAHGGVRCRKTAVPGRSTSTWSASPSACAT